MVTTENVTAIVDEDETPALPAGATMFWKDKYGEWQTVEIISSEPCGWGWATIAWDDHGSHITSTPLLNLFDLDSYLDQQPDYGQFEADNNDAAFDDAHDRKAMIKAGCRD